MAPRRQDFAKVYWEWLRFGEAMKQLPDDTHRLALVRIWTACIHPSVRRDTFEKRDWASDYLADIAGVSTELLLSMLDVGVPHAVARGPRGCVIVCNVRDYHSKLRGWNATPLRGVCGPREERERERESHASHGLKPSDHESKTCTHDEGGELGTPCGKHSTYRPLTGGDPESLD